MIAKNQELTRLISDAEREKVVGLLSGDKADITLMREIVSGPLDADKMDYLLRDSYFCGVEYGKYDLHRLLNTLSSFEDSGDQHLCIEHDGLNSLEQFALAKYYMTKQVYRHRVRLISDAMIVRALELGIEDDHIEFLQKLYIYKDTEEYLENYLAHNDETVTVKLLKEYSGSRAGLLFSKLCKRDLFKQVFSYKLGSPELDPKLTNKLMDISKSENIQFRKELERCISRFGEINCHPEHVIVKSYSIKSVKEMARDSQAPIMVRKTDGTFSSFEEESIVFKSIDATMNEIFLEVYAPLDSVAHRARREKEGNIRSAIIDLLKKEVFEMKARDLILVLLDAEGGSIASKTKIQKEIYFIADQIGLNLHYRAHYYGPYSPDVQDGLEQLIAVGFVSVQSHEWGVDPRGFEMKRYDFSVTSTGKEIVNTIKQEDGVIFEKIQQVVKRLKEIEDLNYINLSIAAKVHFISRKEGIPLKPAEIKSKARSLGWKITDADIENAEAILQKLGYSNN